MSFEVQLFSKTSLTGDSLSSKLPIIVCVYKLHHDSNPLVTSLIDAYFIFGVANVSARISLYVMMLSVFIVCLKHVNLQRPRQLNVPPL